MECYKRTTERYIYLTPLSIKSVSVLVHLGVRYGGASTLLFFSALSI